MLNYQRVTGYLHRFFGTSSIDLDVPQVIPRKMVLVKTHKKKRYRTKTLVKQWSLLQIMVIAPNNGYSPTPLKNMKVSWDHEIPSIWKKHFPNHQPVIQL